MIIPFLFIFGLFIGSFLNVLIDRLPEGKSWIKGRSRCDFCSQVLKWYDLIPLLSYLLLKGRCRYCRKKLSFQYPLLEIITGMSFVFTYLNSPPPLFVKCYLLYVISSLIVIFFTDLRKRIIPDQILFPLTLVTVLFKLYEKNWDVFTNNIPAAFIVSGFFMCLVLITRGKGMGLGDVKYSYFMGLLSGFPQMVISFYTAFLTGAVFSLILVIRGKKTFKSKIPFGPFLVLATIVTMFWGEPLWGVFRRIVGL